MEARHDVRIEWTPRQREVLELLARGLTNGEIARRMEISLAGAKWHVSEVLSKLGVTSREEAAEYWHDEHSVAGRARQWMRGFVGLATLKWIGIGSLAGVVVGVGAILGVALLADGSEPSAELAQPAAATVTARPVYSQSEAEAMAKSLAADVLNGQALLGSGRPFASADFAVVEQRFLPNASTVASNVTGIIQRLDPPANVWRFTLVEQPPELSALATKPQVVVTFEDGTGLFRSGGLVGEDPLASPESRFPAGAVVPLASVQSNGVTIRLYAIRNADLNPQRPQLSPAAGSYSPEDPWCMMEFSSRTPLFLSGGCGLAPPSPVEKLGKPGVSQSGGFAHAFGLVTTDVAKVRARTEDGREFFAEPGPRPEAPDFPWRGFIMAAPGSAWFATVEALNASGNVIASYDFSNHPVSPPPQPPPTPPQ
jgi:DNA-binding CsgD family transcriptional regulator